MNKYDNPRDYILYLLGRKDYSRGELINKAKLKNYPEPEIESAINEFIEKKYIDDDRYCENMVYYYSQNRGPSWIRQKLAQKKIPRELIEKYVGQTKFDANLDLKTKLMRKYKIESFKDLDFKLKSKILAYISRQGYPNSFEIMEKWENQDTN